MLRFRRFSSRVLAMLLGLLFAALATTYFFVSRANERNALERIRSDLETATRVFDEATRQRIEFLGRSANVMAGDYTFKTVLLDKEIDTETVSDALQSYIERLGAPFIALLKPDGTLFASNDNKLGKDDAVPFSLLIREATAQNRVVHSGFSYLKNDLYAVVVAPLYAPRPFIWGWFGFTFPINQSFAGKIKATSRVDVTFVGTGDLEHPRVLATTLSAENARRVATATALSVKNRARPAMLDLADDRYVTLFKTQEMLRDEAVTLVLQRPLSPELAGAHALENQILLISLIALAVAAIFALAIARGVSQPVLALAEHTRHVAAGDYERRIELRREDELGQLAKAFNEMSAGLAERDRVRDLLDKNVSPEVAAQLLRDGATLGGQEREVTILFADLRGFTTLSEKLRAPELLTLLNRYLDRMSGAIEAQGGVIDKFIGDGIMALFGAPVTQSDAPDRALGAALAMEQALAELNRELVSEGRLPLAIGIGINTAHVVAGNIGSHRRLNYSVVGDGVNVAARLESETRKVDYRTNIITSRATLDALRNPGAFTGRPLGHVQVKGRHEPIEIFAVEKKGD